ncbi:HET-domain-containing protein [Xylaria acuta]|nr:HET-domain-containing protein [Xylaria acuta]
MAHHASKHGRLCRYCEQIPLDIGQLRQAGKPSKWGLGTVSRVRQSKCRLCRFISFLLYEDGRTDPMSSAGVYTELNLEWTQKQCFIVNVAGGIQIYFLRNLDRDFRFDRAFRLVPGAGLTIDFQRIRGWMDMCSDKHVGHCKRLTRKAHYAKPVQYSYPELDLLRFIDVQDQCIVETKVICPYVALSYVWGLPDTLRLTTSNKADLIKPGALQQYEYFIPRTICDAVFLAQKIGQRYLWCDALCLIQNDPDDVSRGINTMDLIYENSELTIVAACGHDANAGLPGVHEGTRLQPKFNKEIMPGVRLGGYITLDQRMKRSVYSSRAWTFQEQFLSARCLFFIDNVVYFRCHSATLFEFFDPALDSETVLLEHRGSNFDITSMLPAAMHMLKPFRDFTIFIMYYTQRSLTKQDDILIAMGGIIQRLSRKMRCRFLEGLPTATFDLSILFRCSKTPLRRRHGFPSYSWAGWKGSLSFTHMAIDVNGWLDTSTWIVWYKRSPGGVVNLVWDILANEDFPYGDNEHIGYRQRRPFQLPVSLSLPFPTGRTQPTEDLDRTIPVLNYPVLQFWTLSALFNIEIVDNLQSIALIIGKLGTTCGALYLDDQEGSASFGSTEPCELIALSAVGRSSVRRVFSSVLPASLPEIDRLHNTEFWYNVMLLMWRDGLAERRGIGFITQEAFINKSLPPGIHWKEIVLG